MFHQQAANILDFFGIALNGTHISLCFWTISYSIKGDRKKHHQTFFKIFLVKTVKIEIKIQIIHPRFFFRFGSPLPLNGMGLEGKNHANVMNG